jgi:23S rRNA A2030 N6-methylase RlmJ
MANQHYGRIGDVWKHRPLAEVLAIHRPAEYWESHAGSTRYLLTPSWERDFGVFHFLVGSKQSPLLGASRYRQLLSRCAGFYPGSSEIAMRTLGTASSYLLCDTDPESVRSLAESASELRITSARCEQRDGNDALWEELQYLSPRRAEALFVHLDPWSCLLPSQAHGVTSLDVFRALQRAGAMVMLWFGFDTMTQRREIVQQFEKGWVTEIHLDLMKEARPELNPGVFGCGLYFANLPTKARDAVECLGKELARVYQSSIIAPGYSGSLLYQSSAIGMGFGPF